MVFVPLTKAVFSESVATCRYAFVGSRASSMRRFFWIIPILVVLIPFARLLLNPSALIVDPDRPSVDRALPPDSLAIGNDLTRLFLPHHARIARDLARTGRVPGWDPAGFGGRPLVGNPQAGLWYPPVWIAWTWWRPSALGWLTLAHLGFGGVGVFVLCRSMRIRPFASMVAGCLWSTAPYLLAQTFEGHAPHVWSASYDSWAIWAAIGWKRGRWSGWFLPPILALSILTGHAQETYYLGLTLGGWLLWEWLFPKFRLLRKDDAESQGPHSLGGLWERVVIDHRGGSLAMMIAITVGLVAIEIVPDILARTYTLRRLPPTSSDASKYHVHLSNLAQIVSPFALGRPSNYRGAGSYWESLLSVGLVPFCLAIFAVKGSKRRRIVRAWSALATLTILFAFGRGFGVFDLFFALVPGMGYFRVPSRALFLTTLAATVLVGLGIDAIGRSGRGRTSLAMGLGMLAVFETCFYGFALIRVASPDRFLGPDPVGRAILDHKPNTPFRIRARDAFYGDARAFALNLEKTNLNDSFQIGFAADLYERLYPMFGAPIPTRFPDRFRPVLQAELLDRMNVDLLVSDRQETRVKWPLAFQGEWNGSPFFLQKNSGPLPRAYVVPKAVVLPDGPATVDRFTEFPAREFVILTREALPPFKDGQPFTPAKYHEAIADRIEIDVTTTKPGYLVVSDTWMPGWSAELDGSPVEILRGNRAQRVVVLGQGGEHHLNMTYVPPGLAIGRAITLAALLGWVIGLVPRLRWGNRRVHKEGGNR